MPSAKIPLTGTTILLTGATRGIGRALLTQLINEGAHVIAVARNPKALNILADEYGDQITCLPCDLADPSARDAMLNQVHRLHPRLDGLINNAALQHEMAFFKDDKTELFHLSAREIEVNLTAVVHLTSQLLPRLATAPHPFLLNITTGLALAPKQAAPVYSATKAALRSFTIALRYQAETDCPDLKVIEAIMALVDTDMTDGRGRGKITPEHAAATVLSGIKSARSEIWVAKARLLPLLARISPAIPARILR